VQVHFSVGKPIVELMGRKLPVRLEQLEQTIRLERPDLTDTLAADGTVTIVFTDIVDSTVLTTRLGDHAWLDMLRRHNTVIRDARVLERTSRRRLHESDHFYGTTVHFAARVASNALGGEVLVSRISFESSLPAPASPSARTETSN